MGVIPLILLWTIHCHKTQIVPGVVFFRNAELEKMVDQDLSRLYPEHGSYFQTSGCQGMLRRILLLWCLRHPEYGYRQGMHELLAPLLYVLQADVEHLSRVRKLYEDQFTDRFDGLLCQENDLAYSFDFRKSPDLMDGENESHGNAIKFKSLDELDPKIRTIVLLSDAYGAEGELGIVLSDKFLEHDAFCMFDALMNGARGSVAMADFFSSSVAAGSHTGLPPVIEASAALYHLLFHVDSSLHSHLVDLGVEPQYFALRWLRVLFGREFSLESLLIIWDEIFASDNSKVEKGAEDDVGSSFRILESPRGAFISAMAVSMLLHLRSSLLATENATTCLQRLLNFPENINLNKLLEKAKSFQDLALTADILSSSPSFGEAYNRSKPVIVRRHTLSSDPIPPKTPVNLIPESYWEEKWRDLHKAEELDPGSLGKQVPSQKKRWSEKVKFTLKRTGSDPSSAKSKSDKKDNKASVRRSLLQDLSRELGAEEEEVHCYEISGREDNLSAESEVEGEYSGSKDSNFTAEDRCPSGNAGSEENSSIFSDPTSPLSGANDHENESEKSSVASNLSLDERNEHPHTISNDSPIPVSNRPEVVSQISGCDSDSSGNLLAGSKERKLILSKFQWLWKLGRNASEGTSEKGGGPSQATKSANNVSDLNKSSISSTADGYYHSVSCKGDSVDQNVMGTLRNLGQSMLEHIQVIESVFQQDRSQGASLENLSKNVLVGKGQVTAMTALTELRKISNLLSEM
ncbi:TBC1 domain family member protein [Quillaja saponaria]|uniref:TBC1 domain family member protein n=1 Tax=Quillaja saponaria TaxID=32244 RepID=A0AAD7QDH1_QUISA|nr:TBC1 domain family member protein [Quillaja saponaria]